MTSTQISATTISLTSFQKPLRTHGNDCLHWLQEKNVSRTVGHPGLVTINAVRPPRPLTLDSAAIAWPRRGRRRWAAVRAARRSLLIAYCGRAGPCLSAGMGGRG